jgi:NitT/TauT family transport system substrate-binding protein
MLVLKRSLPALTLTAALVMAATPFSGPRADSDKGDGGVVRILTFPSGNDYPVWAISKLGLDKKYGFEEQMVPTTPGGATLTAFRSGAVDGGNLNWLELARLRTNHDAITGVTPFLQLPNLYVVPADSPIKTIDDLKGKKIGTHSRFAPEWIVYIANAKATAHYDPREAAEIHEAGPGLLLGLLDQKQIDASLLFYNLGMPAIATGRYRVLFASRDLLPGVGLRKDATLSTWAFRDDYIKSHAANVRAFVRAYQEAVGYLQSHDDIWPEMLARQDIHDPKVIELMRDWSRTVTLTKFPEGVNDDTRKMFDVFYSIGGKEALGIDNLPGDIFDLSYTK